jgi:antitoxin (DNA-binding transcriptional repressor) of toxin-antitoxin stability system
LIKAAVSGEQVVITNRGKALVRLVPEAPKPNDPKRGFGSLRHLLADLPSGWDSVE